MDDLSTKIVQAQELAGGATIGHGKVVDSFHYQLQMIQADIKLTQKLNEKAYEYFAAASEATKSQLLKSGLLHFFPATAISVLSSGYNKGTQSCPSRANQVVSISIGVIFIFTMNYIIYKSKLASILIKKV